MGEPSDEQQRATDKKASDNKTAADAIEAVKKLSDVLPSPGALKQQFMERFKTTQESDKQAAEEQAKNQKEKPKDPTAGKSGNDIQDGVTNALKAAGQLGDAVNALGKTRFGQAVRAGAGMAWDRFKDALSSAPKPSPEQSTATKKTDESIMQSDTQDRTATVTPMEPRGDEKDRKEAAKPEEKPKDAIQAGAEGLMSTPTSGKKEDDENKPERPRLG